MPPKSWKAFNKAINDAPAGTISSIVIEEEKEKKPVKLWAQWWGWLQAGDDEDDDDMNDLGDWDEDDHEDENEHWRNVDEERKRRNMIKNKYVL